MKINKNIMKLKLTIQITEGKQVHTHKVLTPISDALKAAHKAFNDLQKDLDDNSRSRVLEVISIEQLQ